MHQLQGELVRLRPVEPDDIELFAQLEYDADAAKFGTGFVPVPWSRHRLTKWLEEQSAKAYADDIYRLVIEPRTDGAAAGVIQTHSIDSRVGVFSHGVVVVEPHRRRGYASDAILTLLRYFFHELSYQKCNVGGYSFND